MNKHLYAVILVGGSGTRFWPLSRRSRPKQFLNIYGQRSLFQETVARLSKKISPKNIFIVSNSGYRGIIRQQLKKVRIPAQNLLFEPSAKNTAPAVCWAAQVIHRKDPEAVMGIFPSDHLIVNTNVFWKTLSQGVALAHKGRLVTMGIVPTRPETGYGYIETAPSFGVKGFREKPSYKKAVEFVQSGKCLWNSGMFVWKTSAILEEFKKYQPEIARYFAGNTRPDKKTWNTLPSISIDYAILERSNKVACVPAKNLGWSDLGSWEALHEVLSKDGAGNFARGDVIHIEGRNNLIWTEGRLVAAIGLDDIVIVDTKDALLVCRRPLSQKVKDVVDVLKKKSRREH